MTQEIINFSVFSNGIRAMADEPMAPNPIRKLPFIADATPILFLMKLNDRAVPLGLMKPTKKRVKKVKIQKMGSGICMVK